MRGVQWELCLGVVIEARVRPFDSVVAPFAVRAEAALVNVVHYMAALATRGRLSVGLGGMAERAIDVRMRAVQRKFSAVVVEGGLLPITLGVAP